MYERSPRTRSSRPNSSSSLCYDNNNYIIKNYNNIRQVRDIIILYYVTAIPISNNISSSRPRRNVKSLAAADLRYAQQLKLSPRTLDLNAKKIVRGTRQFTGHSKKPRFPHAVGASYYMYNIYIRQNDLSGPAYIIYVI